MKMSKLSKLFILATVFLFAAGTAYAAGTKLIFSDVDVKVGSKTDKNLADRETISEDAKPGDNLEFRVEVKNNFTSAENLKIQDVSVKVTVEEIDDGDDLEEESSEFDLSAGRDKKVTLKFQVPIEVDETSFDVSIHAEGEDKNGTNHEADMTLRLDVNKDNHKLLITRKTLSPAEVSCNRKNVQVSAAVINIGSEDEDDVTFHVSSTEFGVDLKDDVGQLTAEPNDEASRFSKTYSFSVPNDVEAGSYPITLKALYDNDRKREEQTATLTVSDCAAAKKVETASESSEGQDVTVITPASGKTAATVVQNAPAGTTATSESLFKSNAFVTGIIIAEVVAVIVGIVLVVSLFRRRQ